MMNVVSSHAHNVCVSVQEASFRPRGRGRPPPLRVRASASSAAAAAAAAGTCLRRRRRRPLVAVTAVGGGESSSGGGDDDDDQQEEEEQQQQQGSSGGGLSREDLERLIGPDDDAKFSGLDLATLIRNKYGRSYDVTLIKKEFMGRNLLALNVMWKYREQRSFPLSEEEYLLRLDEVANTLKCWGAVAHVRNTLQNVKERPRIGKAVSIFIDMDQTGGRSNEWIYK